ncbi:hypothetical protein [Terasakiella sp.]|uniref:DUF7222 domain-containing protein n=1 Tax=Terasakiella sp. TaxID=2034861 RepID=UPI003AA9C7AF
MTTAIEQSRLITVLDDIIQNYPHSMKAHIAQIIMDHDEPETYLSDILNYGCISGCVSELVYYSDTHAFYDQYYYEIEELRQSFEEETGCAIEVQYDLKNFFAWFAFEHTAYQIANEAELDF